ncbi:hypothetical protein M8C21_028013, partial [Ambrosia artemisiifolia]
MIGTDSFTRGDSLAVEHRHLLPRILENNLLGLVLTTLLVTDFVCRTKHTRCSMPCQIEIPFYQN